MRSRRGSVREDESSDSQSQSRSQRPRGRPQAEEPSSTVSVWMWSRHHDQLIQIAHQRGESVSSVARKLLVKSLQRKP